MKVAEFFNFLNIAAKYHQIKPNDDEDNLNNCANAGQISDVDGQVVTMRKTHVKGTTFFLIFVVFLFAINYIIPKQRNMFFLLHFNNTTSQVVSQPINISNESNVILARY
uniref:Transmembrane protein n=1 Tax=Meloidogyne hapla TaxID=6305 RepID=A0A1I8AZT4_MELHA